MTSGCQAFSRRAGLDTTARARFAFARAAKLHAHRHEHDGHEHWHLHSHLRDPGHDHDHRALLGIGMLHGLAGTGALVVALPVAVADSARTALIFLAAFGIGTIMSMALFGAAAGWLLSTATFASLRIHRATISVAGALSLGVGVWWLVSGG